MQTNELICLIKIIKLPSDKQRQNVRAVDKINLMKSFNVKIVAAAVEVSRIKSSTQL